MIKSSNNIVGGSTPASRNVISGNGGLAGVIAAGIHILEGGNRVQGNFIGTDASGTVALGQIAGSGVRLAFAGPNNTIGGNTEGERNIISANGGAGVEIMSTSDTSVQGNYIGTDVTGAVELGNGNSGVFISPSTGSAARNLIGGVNAGERNIISGNHQNGVEIISTGNTGNEVRGNFIGTDASGNVAIGNLQSGVLITDGASNNRIGGLGGSGNIIAFNGDRGVRVIAASSTGNAISANSIFSNTELGIDLGGDEVTPNDSDDSDTGPNSLQNFPVINAATTNVTSTTISGALDSTPNSNFTIEIFASPTCDPSGNGEGQTLVGTINRTTGGGGRAIFGPALVNPVPAGQFVTATATDVNNNTSEFSACVQVTGTAPTPTPTPTATPTPTPLPGLSIDDATVTEGDSGTTNAVFTVSLSPASSIPVNVSFATADITATSGSDYVSISGVLTFNPGVTSQTVTVLVNGDTIPESTEAFFGNLSSPSNASLVRASGIGKITNDDAQASLQFSAANYSTNEDCTSLEIAVARTGDTSVPMDVDYSTLSGSASDRSDYTLATGTLHFAAGDTSRSFNVLITEDSIIEGTETAMISLSNPMGGAVIGSPGTATLTILDDTSEPSTNAIDDTSLFVGQHYHDFLSRQTDSPGQLFWVNNIDSCGADAGCREGKRIDTSAAFFLSIEFQQTGFLVERMYQSAFNRRVLMNEFLRDTQTIGRGVTVGLGNWEQQLETNKLAYFNEVVTRPEFLSLFSSLSNAQYVDALNANTAGSMTTAERNALVSRLNGMTETRATALRQVTENAAFAQAEFNRAFVLMQYFGYLRRNPDESGYQFWLTKLNDFGGDFRRAEMVKAFITSTEYRSRFGQP
jgi:hypothetical protein